MLAPLVNLLAAEPVIEAIAVVGSHASGRQGEGSDIDLFVYSDRPHEQLLDLRRRMAEHLADPDRYVAIGQTGHPYADTWALAGNGTWLDVMFWTTSWADDELDWRLDRTSPQIGGPSTAFWRSIRDGLLLFDRDGWLDRLQQRARSPYPEALRAEILRMRRDLLGGDNPFSLSNQLAHAVEEGDAVASQHRCAAWLVAYFDLLFAANRVLHPGEKRLVSFVEDECASAPPMLRADVERLIRMSCDGDAGIDLQVHAMVERADEVVAATD